MHIAPSGLDSWHNLGWKICLAKGISIHWTGLLDWLFSTQLYTHYPVFLLSVQTLACVLWMTTSRNLLIVLWGANGILHHSCHSSIQDPPNQWQVIYTWSSFYQGNCTATSSLCGCSRCIVTPNHLEIICSQKGVCSKRTVFLRLSMM